MDLLLKYWNGPDLWLATLQASLLQFQAYIDHATADYLQLQLQFQASIFGLSYLWIVALAFVVLF
jgi:hypothetical protein